MPDEPWDTPYPTEVCEALLADLDEEAAAYGKEVVAAIEEADRKPLSAAVRRRAGWRPYSPGRAGHDRGCGTARRHPVRAEG